MRIGIIADDITGAMDTGAQFRIIGLRSVLSLRESIMEEAEVLIANTESRDGNERNACDQVRRAAKAFDGYLLFKKIDSTLRGHLAAEIGTLLDASRYRSALICPAVIEEGRLVINGQLWVDGQPLHRTPFAADPVWPAQTASIQERIGASCTHVSLNIVRSGPNRLRQFLRSVTTPFIVSDAIEDGDLRAIAKGIASSDILPCGAKGLARAWVTEIADLKSAAHRLELKARAPLLYCIGSHHPRTRKQMDALVECAHVSSHVVHDDSSMCLDLLHKRLEQAAKEGKSFLLRTPNEWTQNEDDRSRILQVLAKVTREIVRSHMVGGIFVCGGATAYAIIRELRTHCIEIQGEVQSGIPWGTLHGGFGEGLPIMTKAGGFGDRGSIVRFHNRYLT